MGNKLRTIRKNAGLTQEELAKKAGVTRFTIIGLEKGTNRNTSTNTLLRIADALGMAVQDIFFTESV